MKRVFHSPLSRTLTSNTCRECLVRRGQQSRALASSTRLRAEAPTNSARPPQTPQDNVSRTIPTPEVLSSALTGIVNQSVQEKAAQLYNRHHLHVFAHKHNTHLTLTRPNHNYLISLSTGNLGFRKSNRGTYDAAYQLAAYVLAQIKERGILPDIQQLEVVLRGFGVGREAVTKAILGAEGRFIRDKISKVSDGTRIKFGGTRSPKPRRLG